jgi:hypothetical protein
MYRFVDQSIDNRVPIGDSIGIPIKVAIIDPYGRSRAGIRVGV